MNITELSNIFAQNNIIMPLPWNGYDGAFCCRSCVTYEISSDEYKGYNGAVWCCEQGFEDVKCGQLVNIWFSHGAIVENGEATDEENKSFTDSVVRILNENHVPFSWNGDIHKSIQIVVNIDYPAYEWIDANHQYDDDEDDYTDYESE